jgi:multidrug efflux pump subunit AcrB
VPKCERRTLVEAREPFRTNLAKRKGVNPVDLVQAVQGKVASLRGARLPADVHVATTRDYGATAKAKSDELLLHMGIAVFSVALRRKG